jgi:hypothetical protein
VAGLGLLDVHQFVDLPLDFEQVGIGVLADFAFERLPVETGEVVRLSFLDFGGEPGLEAVVVDEPDTS